ncbi:MAG: CBM2 domain fused to hydrolase of the alpha/beta superfamily [Candidatus Ozemobacter sibiricus]|uniref:CBM2 domain fused to hydrolase of the alpha/beta superfamily n=1 Tax=Candidatus Ozemobacter sibiricus TaxID=2268124 RepID=A0A367ZNP4_9BACT|nr:MAG: CBM2 domain fused to hydrolase of the alpha/beta superfamily [Candidatus Ozemobacter sibiricus]
MAKRTHGATEPSVQVTLQVRLAPNVTPDDGLFVAGNLPALGDWQPAAVALPRVGPRLFALTFAAPIGKPVEFKITRGTWKSQAIYLDPAGRFPPDNRVIVPTRDQRVEVTVIDWLDRIALAVDPVVGDLRRHEPMSGPGLREPRAIQVWLPPSYASRPERRYPVLYMHDGQNLFDPATSFCGQDWKVDEVATRLITEGRLRELIVVAIDNTGDRMEEYNLARPRGRAYATFLIEVVKPFIDRTYRTLPEPEQTGVMGSSMGGLISFQLAWTFPEIFGLAGCLSSAFYKAWAATTRLVRGNPASGRRLRLYFDAGELEPPIATCFHKMQSLLREVGLQPGREFLAHFAPGATHSERAWSDRLHLPLEFLFGSPSGR